MSSKLKSWIKSLKSPSQTQHGHNQLRLPPPPPPPARAVREPSDYDETDTAELLRAQINSMRPYYSSIFPQGIDLSIEIIGAPGVGKSSLRKRLIYDDMNGGYRQEMDMLLMDDEQCCYLCGRERYRLGVFWPRGYDDPASVGEHPSPNHALVVAYDVSSQRSYDEMVERIDGLVADSKAVWLRKPDDLPNDTSFSIMIIGLKADDDVPGGGSIGEVAARARCLAEERGFLVGECSAKSGRGVGEAFGLIVEAAHAIRREKKVNRSVGPWL